MVCAVNCLALFVCGQLTPLHRHTYLPCTVSVL